MADSTSDMKDLWNHPYTGYLLGLLAITACIYFGFHSPAPGVGIGVLGAVAAMMSVRTLISWEKFGWMVIVFFLLYTELNAIRTDRQLHDKEVATARTLELKKFREIAQDLDASVKSNERNFQTTSKEIRTTLDAANKTIIQTQPRALFAFQNIQSQSIRLVEGATFRYNVHFQNTGNGSARGVSLFTKTYVGPYKHGEKNPRFSSGFDRAWKVNQESLKKQKTMTVTPNEPYWFSATSDPLSRDDVQNLSNQTETIYFFIRFAYADDTGRWLSDHCLFLQPEGTDIYHVCPGPFSSRHKAH